MSVTGAAGFLAAGVTAGLKPSGRPDLALVVNTGPDHVAAAVFTSNRVKAAPDAKPGMVRGVSMAGELIAIMDMATGEDGVTPEWQPKKVFFS